jgi:DNA-binding winged helix-turn-helix (wHTH) protein/Flp pilus assembly protein TadD
VGTHSRQRVYEFDDFRLDAGHLILSRKEREISLPPRAVETLLALVERPGEVISKDELLDAVWPDTTVDESNLFAYLSQLRKALGNRKNGQPYVETLRRRGYRFVGEVKVVTKAKPEIAIKAVHPAADQKLGRRNPSRISANGGNVIELGEWLEHAPNSAQGNTEENVAEIVVLSPSARRTPDRRPLVIVTVLGILIFGSLGLYIWKVNSQPAAIPTVLRPELTEGAKARLARRETDNPEAYRLYELGSYHTARLTLPETQKGINYLEQATALDPNFALAFAKLADAYRMQTLGGDLPATEVLPKSKAAALTALALDDGLAEVHVAAGQSAMWYDRNWEEAEIRAKRALDLEPNYPAAIYLLENLYSFLGRHDEAIAMGETACQLVPTSPLYNSIEAQTLLYAGHVEEALQRALRARDLDDNFWHVHLTLARIYAQKGMYPEAIAEADRAAKLSGDHSYDLAVKGYALARSGREIEARGIIDELLKRARNARHNTNVALVYTGLRDKEKALEHLERGFEDHELQHELRSAPAWDELRPEPRFTELMRKLRFE